MKARKLIVGSVSSLVAVIGTSTMVFATVGVIEDRNDSPKPAVVSTVTSDPTTTAVTVAENEATGDSATHDADDDETKAVSDDSATHEANDEANDDHGRHGVTSNAVSVTTVSDDDATHDANDDHGNAVSAAAHDANDDRDNGNGSGNAVADAVHDAQDNSGRHGNDTVQNAPTASTATTTPSTSTVTVAGHGGTGGKGGGHG